MNFGTFGYGAAAVAFALLAALLMVNWRRSKAADRLLFAACGTSLWAAVMAWSAYRELSPRAVFLAESLHFGVWLYALSALGSAAIPRALAVAGHLSWIAMVVIGLALPVAIGVEVTGATFGALMARGGVVAALLGLVMVEQIYRNSEVQVRSTVKWLVAGAGTILAYDFFMYSQSEILRGISADAWNARGVVYAMSVPVIAMAMRRNAEWKLDIFVSRHVVFYGATFLVVGVGLLLMSLGGYYVREVGGTWGVVAQILFWSAGSLILVALLASDLLRRRMKVFISKHFYKNKYDYRLEWLRFIRTLSSADEGDVRRTALRAVTQILGSPGGALLLLDDGGRAFSPVAAWPVEAGAIPGLVPVSATDQLASFLGETQWIMDLEEYRASPEVYRHIEIPGWLRADPTLRIVAPMLQLDRLVGIFILYGPPAPFELTFEDRDLLKTVSQHVATQIAQHEADRKLAESSQFEAFNKLTAFMMHDLKNSVAQLKLIVVNAERHKRNPDFVDDALATISNTVKRMTSLIEQLSGAGTSAMRVVALDELTAAAVHRCRDRLPAVAMTLTPATAWVNADPDRLGAVIEHVLRNAQEATPASGTITCSLEVGDGVARLSIQDSGAGMSSDFVRDRLFRPFDSTKGAKGMGIGAYQVREYVRMLGGDVEVQSSPGRGTRFSISIPISSPPQSREAAGGLDDSTGRATSGVQRVG